MLDILHLSQVKMCGGQLRYIPAVVCVCVCVCRSEGAATLKGGRVEQNGSWHRIISNSWCIP